jgi:molybdopterin-guanine dinucleotide biosynthesis protein MobB
LPPVVANAQIGGLYGAPVLAICGFSGSGKTSLLEAVIPQLVARGLAIAVVKHDAHGFEVDQKGKDSDRLFRAGASVALRGPQEQFQRRGSGATLSLEATLAGFACDHDLLLVEGHKDTPLPKLWMGSTDESAPPASVTGIEAILPWDTDRREQFFAFLHAWLPRAWIDRPLHVALALPPANNCSDEDLQQLPTGHVQSGAGSSVPGGGLADLLFSKEQLSGQGCPSRVVVLGRSGQKIPAGVTWLAPPPDLPAPAVQDVDSVSRAELAANLLTAHRWAPRASWIMVLDGRTGLAGPAMRWLASFRHPGTWAVLPRALGESPGTRFVLCEPQALALIERLALEEQTGDAIREALTRHPRTISPELPPDLTLPLQSRYSP